MKEQKTYYGFYSNKATLRGNGIFKYKTPDGKEVLVTNVTTDPTGSDYHFDDKEAMGKVTEFIRTILKPNTVSLQTCR